MSENTLLPCPVCGGDNLIAAYYSWSMRHFIQCKGCHIDFAVSETPAVARSTYQRLARAVALLRAVERLDQEITTNRGRSLLYWRVPIADYNGIIGDQAELSLSSGHRIRAQLADALIALAEVIDVRSH